MSSLISSPSIINKIVPVRAPANVLVKKIKSTDTANFDCATKKISTNAQQIRLRGSLCPDFDLGQLREIQVKNQKSGDSGSLFILDRKTITTEYLRLAEGENKISFKQKNHSFELIVIKGTRYLF